MIFSNNIQKNRKAGSPQNNYETKRKIFKYKDTTNQELVLRGTTNYSHPKLREMQRYNTCCVKRRKLIEDIHNDKAAIIEQDDNKIKALVRFSSRYYVVIFDPKINKIKTFLPDNIPNLLDYVQELLDKENKTKLDLAA